MNDDIRGKDDHCHEIANIIRVDVITPGTEIFIRGVTCQEIGIIQGDAIIQEIDHIITTVIIQGGVIIPEIGHIDLFRVTEHIGTILAIVTTVDIPGIEIIMKKVIRGIEVILEAVILTVGGVNHAAGANHRAETIL